MNWPVPQDFNEAVQTPGLAFSDPELKAGQVVVGAHGMPLPRSGNFADVYQIRGADGRNWAVKCFTRPVVGLDDRYRKIGDHLGKLKLPVTVDFQYLPEGVRVRGKWHPALKMEWVEGLLINQFVRDNVSKPHVLEGLFQMWVRLCRRLRDAGIAHADLQHGNVLLVPGAKAGSLGLKLIDYDGMYIPALANTPSGELGHANYQHPGRAAKQTFSPDLDRFPHLVIATAVKALAHAGPSLWDRYDTGENLLFVESDFLAPAQSPLMQELLHTKDAATLALLGRLAAACKRPITQTPWLDQIAPDGVVSPATAAESRDLLVAFDLGASPPPAPKPAPQATRQAAGTRMAPQPAHEPATAVLRTRPAPIAAPVVAEASDFKRWKYAIATLAVLLVLVVGGIIYRLAEPRASRATASTETPPGETTPPVQANPVPPPPATVDVPDFVAPVPRLVPELTPPQPPPVEVAIAPLPRLVEPETVRPPEPVPAGKRQPVPDEPVLAMAAEKIHELFKTKYTKKGIADRKALAAELLKLAEATNDDPAARYAALQDARDFAIEGHDPAGAMQAVETTAKYYELDPAALRIQALEKMASVNAFTPVTHRAVVDQAFSAADITLDQDDYDSALRLAQIAANVARKTTGALEEADYRLAQIRKLREGFSQVKSALDRLATTPDDPDANLTVGRFRAFVQGRWDQGLPYLSRGSDAGLKAAAQAELEPPGATPNNLKIAETWWAAAQTASDADRRIAEARSRFWYRSALAGLSGLTQKTAENRLGFTLGGVEYDPGLVAEFAPINFAGFNGKKGRVDPTIDFNAQEFDGKGKTRNTSITLKWTGLFQPMIPGRYTLEVKSADSVRLKVNNKVLVDFTDKGPRKSAVVSYTDRALPIQIEYKGLNSRDHGVKLLWRPPGAAGEELVPVDVLFHDKKAAAAYK